MDNKQQPSSERHASGAAMDDGNTFVKGMKPSTVRNLEVYIVQSSVIKESSRTNNGHIC